MMKNGFILLILILLAGILASCSSEGATSSQSSNESGGSMSSGKKVIKLGSVNNEQHTLFKGYEKFKELIEERTEGNITVEIYPNGQLGDDRTMIEGLQFGTLEAVGVSTSMLANWAPPMLAYDLPFVFPNADTAYSVLDGPYGEKVGKLLEEEDLVFLAYFENGFRQLTNSTRKIESVKDIDGLKIRVMQTPVHIETWSTLGASPTPMAYTELFTAMQQGVIDGQENPFGNTAMDRFYEVQEYMTVTNHVYNPMGLVISKKIFDGFSEEEKKIVLDSAKEAGDYQRQLNQKEDQNYKKMISDGGTKITELTPEAHAEFEEAVKSVYDEFVDEIGQDYLDEFLAEIENVK
ncbi:TRAP transporter substrate-binding protein [Metabacillus idriensis]|uniref:DctP family TRAP transporter solute-binding subunit n=1 Tax=Metabacillus idriensis TaxID=324768 RepID=A0A6I2MEP4_9BACI|nr:TRAP transporter substrate-binding protein [Metabacillus idriensis]MCM3598044.1 TRAP transporter substrate-binding protein [Metabacillus idriensis]MRX56848.1 DctP family TRAP transporter solute-binding subunit [Metabacillus idriensis]